MHRKLWHQLFFLLLWRHEKCAPRFECAPRTLPEQDSSIQAPSRHMSQPRLVLLRSRPDTVHKGNIA